jgi:hypothetical protein
MELYHKIIGVIFALIIILKFVIIYGYIFKKKIGIRFKTELSNSLHNKNNVYATYASESRIGDKEKYLINPTFQEIYNIIYNTEHITQPDFIEDNMINLDSATFNLKLIGGLIILVVLLMLSQEYLENSFVSELFEIPTIVILIILLILATFVVSVLYGVQFYKMRNLIPDPDNDTPLESVIKHLSLYKSMEDLLDTISDNTAFAAFKTDYLDKYFLNKNFVPPDPTEIEDSKFINMLKTTYPTLNIGGNVGYLIYDLFVNNNKYASISSSKEMKVFITALRKILTDAGITNLPSPFNGGDNKYDNIYNAISLLGLITAGATALMCMISSVLVFINRQS